MLPALAVISALIPLIISGMEHCFESAIVGDSLVGTSFLSAESYGHGSMVAALIGAIIMLISEIAQATLLSVYSKELILEDRAELLSGKSMKEYMLSEDLAEKE